MKRVEIDINLNVAGRGLIVVDGQDISDAVRAVSFESKVGAPTRVTFDVPMVHEARLRGDAFVWVSERVGDALHLLGWTAPDGTTPAYVHALLDAFLTGQPLDFAGATVPADVQARISTALDKATT